MLFKGQGLRSFFIDYLRRFPTRIISNNVIISPGTGQIKVTGFAPRITISPDKDLNAIIKYFEKEVEEIHNRISIEASKTQKALDAFDEKFRSSLGSLKDKIKKTNIILEDSAVSNIWADTFGVAIIFLGLILATIPDYVIMCLLYNK